jgi:hypothetical protein
VVREVRAVRIESKELVAPTALVVLAVPMALMKSVAQLA